MVAVAEKTDVLEAKAAQRKGAKRATFDKLKAKAPNQRELSIKLGEETVSLLFRAIGATEYDRLVTKCAPTTEQKAEGATYNPDAFAPALLARVCAEPLLDENEWREIWTSPDWSRGEASDLFFVAVNLCSKGLEEDPTAAG